MLGFSLLVTWRNIWVQAVQLAVRSADGAAEHNARILNAYTSAADRISEATRGLTEAQIRADEALWHRHLQGQIARLRLALDAKLIGADGRVLAAASESPPPDVSMAMREYVTALETIPEGEPWKSRDYERAVDGRRFFAISRARHLPDEGAVAVALDQGLFGDGLARVSIQPG